MLKGARGSNCIACPVCAQEMPATCGLALPRIKPTPRPSLHQLGNGQHSCLLTPVCLRLAQHAC